MIYDSEGHLVQLTNPEGNATDCEYEDINRPQTETIVLPKCHANGDVIPGELTLAPSQLGQ